LLKIRFPDDPELHVVVGVGVAACLATVIAGGLLWGLASIVF
jgi:hypothetical protein